MIQGILAIWSLVPLLFLNPAWTSGSSRFMYCWSLAWKILSITLLWCEMSAIVWWFEHSLALPFFGIGMKTDLFQPCGHCWVFQICWHIECSIFTASSFSIWNSSTGISSPSLALFVVMFPKAYLTSHSRMSGSRWVITPSWLSESWRFFLYSSSVYCCYHFFIPSASVRSIPLLSFIMPIFAWNVPLVFLIFLKRSPFFPILLFSSISLHWSLKTVFLSFLAILWNSEFKWLYLSIPSLILAFLLFTAICKGLLKQPFCFFAFFLGGMVLIAASFTMSWTSTHSSSGTPSIRSNTLKLFVTSTV